MRTCSVSSPTQRDVLKEGMIAGFSFVPFGPMIGSRLQKMSGVLRISFFSIPVDMSSLSTITPGKHIRQSKKTGECQRNFPRAQRGRARGSFLSSAGGSASNFCAAAYAPACGGKKRT